MAKWIHLEPPLILIIPFFVYPVVFAFSFLTSLTPETLPHIPRNPPTSSNEFSPITPFTPRWEFRQMSAEVTDNIHTVLLYPIYYPFVS